MIGPGSSSPKARSHWLAVALVLLASLTALLYVPSTHAAVYWGDGGAIGAAKLDGGFHQHGYFRPDYPTYGPIASVAVSSDYLYWGGRFGIGRVPLYGPEIVELLVETESWVNGLAVDGSHLYWTTLGGEEIGRANLDGSDPTPQFISGIESPCGVAVDERFIYWGGLFTVGRARLDGGGVEKHFISTDPACGVAVDRDYLYWGDSGGPSVHRARLQGGGQAEALFQGAGAVSALAVDSGHLYWTADVEGYSQAAAIGRLDLATATADPNWLTTNTPDALYGVAVDSLASPPPLPPESKPAEITSIKRNRRNGTLLVDVHVPAMGKLGILAPRFAWKILGKQSRKAEVSPGEWRIKLWAGRGTASEGLRLRLLRRGRASVRLRLGLREFGKELATTEKRVTFVRTRGSGKGQG